MTSLAEQARSFAATLTELVNGTVSNDVQFVTTLLDDDRTAWVAPYGSEKVTKPALIPLTVRGVEPRLWLAAQFTTRLDDEGEHLSVASSKFALCVDHATSNSLIRVEYERGKGHEPGGSARHRRPAAHVQVHGSSTQLGHAQALAGSRYRPLEKLHFPVGGRRFRPSLEDFIEFLYDEGLLPATHEGWRDVLDRTRGDYLFRQLRAAVRRDGATAADQLRTMGYEVTPPPE